jgi:hypothetical protein
MTTLCFMSLKIQLIVLIVSSAIRSVCPCLACLLAWLVVVFCFFSSLFPPHTLSLFSFFSFPSLPKQIGSEEKDELLFEEKDEKFWVHVRKSSSDRFVLISSSSKLTSEFHYLDLEKTKTETKTETESSGGKFKVLLAREQGHEYTPCMFVTLSLSVCVCVRLSLIGSFAFYVPPLFLPFLRSLLALTPSLLSSPFFLLLLPLSLPLFLFRP